jgi:hypothetical protein
MEAWMSMRSLILAGVFWVVSLVAAVAVAAGRAQTPDPRPFGQPPDARIVTGADIGFRIESWQGNTPTGTWLIRVDGKWVEAASAKKPVLLTR